MHVCNVQLEYHHSLPFTAVHHIWHNNVQIATAHRARVMGDTATFDIGIVEDAELQRYKCKGKSIYICPDGIDILAPQDAIKSKNCLVRVAILELDTVHGTRRVTAVKALGDVLDNAVELGTCVYTDADGVTRHYVAGELHREGDLPAVDGPFIKEYNDRGNLHYLVLARCDAVHPAVYVQTSNNYVGF